MSRGSPQGRNGIGNLGLNAALAVGAIVVVVLGWSLAERWLGEPGTGPSEDLVQVDVRNGCGVPGLAARMALYLRERGFDVVEAGNHVRSDVAASYIADRVGRPDPARRLAIVVGLPEERILEEIRSDYLLDATLIIGCDYATLRPYSEE